MTTLAELLVRHTRRHMPTRRVAVESAFLPTHGAAHGLALLEGVVSEAVVSLDEDDRDAVIALVRAARSGDLTIPRIAARHRLQHDFHGLARSRHRILTEPDGLITLELDIHGPALPQLLAAILAAGDLPASARPIAVDAIERGIAAPGRRPAGYGLRLRTEGEATKWHEGMEPGAPTIAADPWHGVGTERRWALEVLGLNDPTPPEASEIQRRFRRLLREAHPDHGARHSGAAERIDMLREARSILLDWQAAVSVPAPDPQVR